MAYLFKKKKGDKYYWYLGENQRVNGRVKRIWEKYVGPAKNVANRLAYGTIPEEIEVLDLGICAALLNINDKLKFIEIINKILPKREQGIGYGEHLLITLINRIDNPLSKNKLGEWFDGTILKRIYPVKRSYLSSQDFWNHWNNISEEDINRIQEKILEILVEKCDISDLCFDPTNFTAYTEEHKNQKIMQFGHAKDRRRLRQVNLSLLVTKEEGIPLWHHTYDGNINDVTEFKEFIKLLIERVEFFAKKCKKITLVFDKGNNSKNNIKKVNKKLSFFIVGSLKPSEHKELFDIPLEKFNEEYRTSEGKRVFCTSKIIDLYEGKKKVVVTYSNELAYKNRNRVLKAIEKAINQLKNLQGRLKNSRLTRDELLIKVSRIADKSYIKGLIDYKVKKLFGELKLSFSEDEKAYEEKAKGFGKNILFTDDLSLKVTEVARLYNEKSVIEEQFKNLKDKHVISFMPMWCWTDKMIKVHAFTCVMALLFLKYLIKEARENNINLSQTQIIEQLIKIKQTLIRLPRRKEIHTKITSLNEHQRILAKTFEIRKYAK